MVGDVPTMLNPDGDTVDFSFVTPQKDPLRPHAPSRHSLGQICARFDVFDARESASGEAGSDVWVTGIAVGSSDVHPGDLFVALTGLKKHGIEFVADAVDRGAVAILTDDAGRERALATGLPVLLAQDPRAAMGPLSAWLYGEPSSELLVIGVTGTNGKTTTSYLIDAALQADFAPTAILGTVELRMGDFSIPSPRTTVESPVLHGILASAREQGVKALTTEVSSHALALRRVDGVEFDIVAFTNLQRDHLDFHGDMDNYFATKSQLFDPAQARRGVICVDDEWGQRLATRSVIPVDTVSANPSATGHADAAWRVEDIEYGRLGVLTGNDSVSSHFTLHGPDGVVVRCESALPGSFNVANAAVATVVAFRAGVDLDIAARAIAQRSDIPGRMEQVGSRGPGPLAVVDYAHTPDALVLVLEALRPVTPGRLIHVFGSDGDRDRGKRPIMGEISAKLADVLIVTDENPRSEVPSEIRAEILAGVARVPDTHVLEAQSRVEAIATAVELAQEADTIVITGKGHEPFQEIAGVFHPQLDSDELRRALARRWS